MMQTARSQLRAPLPPWKFRVQRQTATGLGISPSCTKPFREGINDLLDLAVCTATLRPGRWTSIESQRPTHHNDGLAVGI